MRPSFPAPNGAGNDVQVAAIYFPSWHADPRREAHHGPGWSEWELVKAGRPRFPGHAQPLEPAWGYADECDPAVMARTVATAAAHGINAFLWDWYWYDGAGFLNRPLDEAYLTLPDPATKFAIMWANHDWDDVFPVRPGTPHRRIWPAAVDAAEFRRMTDLIIDRYLTHPAYWRVNGAAWFTIFMLHRLQDGLGGVDATATALEDFRRRARAAGAGELHLNAMGGRWHGDDPTPPRALGIDSVGPYNWLMQLPLQRGLAVPYADWRRAAETHRLEGSHHCDLPHIPNVTMGWDSTTRVHQDDALTIGEWPCLPVVVDNTPDEFGAAVRTALDYLDQRPGPRVLTINAWNEWTEGSYLEPDRQHGTAYLAALAEALGRDRALA